MSQEETLKGKFSLLSDKDFYKKTLILMLPVILQQLISHGINFFDNIMVGDFGEVQIAATSFGNQFYALFQFICLGLGSGAIVLSSQFWGRKDLSSLKETTSTALKVCLVCCATFSIISIAFPDFIISLYTHDTDVIAMGAPYLRLLGTTFILAGLSSTSTYLLRSVGSVKVPLIASAISFALNIFFNWVFIFGMLGAPRLEILGAAVGTIIARIFEFVLTFGYFIFCDKKINFRFKDFLISGARIRKAYVKYGIPILISDLLLGLSLSISSAILGHITKEISAAFSIVNSLVQILNILNFAFSGAAAVIVGNTIGSGDIKKAKIQGNCYILISFLFGLFIIIPLLLIEGPYTGIYNVSEETLSIIHDIVIVNTMFMPLQAVAYITSKGLLRGGGDSLFLLIADSSCIWLLSIPLAALAAFVWHLSPFWIVFLLRFEYPLKGLICLARYLSGKWIKEIKAKPV